MTTPKTLAEMTAEVRALNTEKGWRTGDNTYGDYNALLHSEISEMLEAYRDRRLEPYTTPAGKPDDVGAEAADVLIRLIDMADVFDVRLKSPKDTLGEIPIGDPAYRTLRTFGDHVDWLHKLAATDSLNGTLRGLLYVCARFGVDLDRHYSRKMKFNATRPFQHGGRTLHDNGRVTAGGNAA